MGKILRLSISLLITLALLRVFSAQTGALPPLGRFFSPHEGFWMQAENLQAQPKLNYAIPGLKAAAKVVYDDRQVPHIFAANEEDAYFLQGYVTARHRLWQMDMQTRLAAGRLSEVLGPKLLDRDRESRRIGLKWGASRSLATMMQHPVSRMVLTRYTAGVNAYIAQLRDRDLPLEYKLLDFKPEAWTPLKSILLVKYMSNMLTGYEHDFEYTNIAKLYGIETLNQLFPEFPDSLDPIIPKGTAFTQSDSLPNYPADSIPLVLAHRGTDLHRPEPGYGSNNWAVSGSRTASGKPILCNDPHLGLNLPSIWYEVQLHAPGMNVYGTSIPGAPCVITGFNDNIAWGITNAAMDVKDWYKVRFRDSRRKQYLMDSTWKPVRRLIERFDVRGQEVYYDTILFTEHGPVVYDKAFGTQAEKKDMALRWTAHDYSNVLFAFYGLNHAASHADYAKALENFDVPGQNFVFASASGDIAIRHNGKFVKRYSQQGRMLLDGARSDHLWQGYIPWNDIPQIKNPERGFVSSANQHPTDASYPYYYTGIYEYYRNRRLNQLLAQTKDAKPEDMMRIQNDNYNLCAAEVLPWMLRNLPQCQWKGAEAEALKALQNWTYFNDPQAVGAIYFEEWYNRFQVVLWDELRSNERSLVSPGNYLTWYYLQRYPDSPFIDKASTPQTETLAQLMAESFFHAVSKVTQWKNAHPQKELQWAAYKNTTVKHLSQQAAFSIDQVPIGGNAGIINATSHSKGASWRLVVVPGEQAWGVYPGGQSENPGSPHYADFIDEWAAGRYFELLLLQPQQSHSRIHHVENLTP